MLTLLRFVGVGVEAVHVTAAGVKFAAAGVGVVAVHVFGAAVSVIASSTGGRQGVVFSSGVLPLLIGKRSWNCGRRLLPISAVSKA